MARYRQQAPDLHLGALAAVTVAPYGGYGFSGKVVRVGWLPAGVSTSSTFVEGQPDGRVVGAYRGQHCRGVWNVKG